MAVPAEVSVEQRGCDLSVPVTEEVPWEQRVAWRLAHPEEWRALLEGLPYYDPDFPFDEAHEYEYDWSTDPDLFGPRFLKVDENFIIVDEEAGANYDVRRAMFDELTALLGPRTALMPNLTFGTEIGAAVGLLTEGGKPSFNVLPDLAVLAEEPRQSEPLFGGQWLIDMPSGHAAPILVVEVLSPSTVRRDLTKKMRLYAYLGVSEYVVCDVQGGLLRAGESAPQMDIYRLQDRQYELSRRFAGEPASGWSELCGNYFRLRADDMHFQRFDADDGRWRDLNADRLELARAENLAEGRAEGVTQERQRIMVSLLRGLLAKDLTAEDLEAIEESWTRYGVPADAVERLIAVGNAPAEWRRRLLIEEPPCEGGDSQPA